MLLQAALNGKRALREHPALPITPAQLAAEARGAIGAGARAIHLHVRDDTGGESLAPIDVTRTLEAVRAASHGVPIGLSTGAWIVPDRQQRFALIEQWSALPDFASVNFDEDGAPELSRLLLDRGVAVEAGVLSAAAASVLAASGLADRCLRVLIEPGEPNVYEARANVVAIEQTLDRAGLQLPRLLHGSDATAWPILRDAIARGYASRIGLEDTLELPDRTLALDNAALVAAAQALKTK